MPNTQQAKKRMRQDDKRRARNRARKSEVKTYTRKVLTAIEEGSAAAAQEEFRLLQVKADKAAKTGSIHPNKAARRKSRLQKRINALKAQQPAS